MSAQTSRELRTNEQAACYVDMHGRTLCTICYHSGVDHTYDRSRDTSGECERCGKSLDQSIELVDGWAIIEYTTAKIF